MTFNVTDDFVWNEELSYDENLTNCEARINHLREWGNKWWGKELNAITCCAVAEVLEMRLELAVDGDPDTYGYVTEDEWRDNVEDLLHEHMWACMDEWVKHMDIDKAVMNHGCQWMLWSVGYQTSGVYDIVNDWLETDGQDYPHKDTILSLMDT